MKKAFLLFSLGLTLTSFASGHKYEAPKFEKSVTYATCNNSENLPLEMVLGKSNGKDLAYIKKYGRIFLEETSTGYIGENNNFEIIKNDDGTLTVKTNVLMIDVNYISPKEAPEKNTFYHSYGGYLHSHIYPKLDKGLIEIANVDYEVKQGQSKNLYREKNDKFSVLFIPTMKYGNKQDLIPGLVELKFNAKLCQIK